MECYCFFNHGLTLCPEFSLVAPTFKTQEALKQLQDFSNLQPVLGQGIFNYTPGIVVVDQGTYNKQQANVFLGMLLFCVGDATTVVSFWGNGPCVFDANICAKPTSPYSQKTNYSHGITNTKQKHAKEYIGLLFVVCALINNHNAWNIIDNTLSKHRLQIRDVLQLFECFLCFESWCNKREFWT